MESKYSISDLIFSEDIIKEYKRTLLLSIFKKICTKMNNDTTYRNKLRNIFLQSYDKTNTMQLIVEREFSIKLTLEEAETMTQWYEANQKKALTRKKISNELKEKLIKQQNGVCTSCGNKLPNDKSKIHVDHIIPWLLVGDELENNYQVLCETCNECKSSRIDYMFYKKLKLI